MDPVAPLAGKTIAITADRKAAEQGDLFIRRGAAVVFGPTISTVAVGHDDGLRAATEDLIARPPDDVLVTTGAGLRAWVEAAGAIGLGDALVGALARARVTTRGPKSSRAARSFGLEPAMQPASERLDDAVDLLLGAGVAGRRVAVQEHGQPTEWVAGALRDAGADVTAVAIYRWRLPDDPAPAQAVVRAAITGRLDAVTFTSAPAVANLMTIADLEGSGSELLHAFNHGGVVAGCVGIVCAETARAEGITDPQFPDVGRLGLLVRVVEDAVRRRGSAEAPEPG
jgi:uroporphyrinogen-III synthase